LRPLHSSNLPALAINDTAPAIPEIRVPPEATSHRHIDARTAGNLSGRGFCHVSRRPAGWNRDAVDEVLRLPERFGRSAMVIIL
jgi:hypothetical protein